MVISRTPLRISFFGGGTDYPEFFRHESGAVLATAIHHFNHVTASRFPSHLFDYSIRVSYRKVELVRKVDEIEHRVYRECLRFVGVERDIELHAVADLPAFSGLGSSSSFTVALLHALHAYKNESVTPAQLANEAIYIERERLNESVGCQDQVMAAFGGMNLIEFRGENQFQVHPVTVPASRLRELEAHFVLVFTGLIRKASDMAAVQVQRIPDNRQTLREMRAMVDRGYQILTGNTPLSAFGEMLDEAWQKKRALAAVISSPAIDDLYTRARQAGALGGKLLGAGGGGFLLFFVPPERHASFERAMEGRAVLHVSINAPASRIIFSA